MAFVIHFIDADADAPKNKQLVQHPTNRTKNEQRSEYE